MPSLDPNALVEEKELEEELAQNDLYKSINGKIGDFEDEYKNVLDYVDKINDDHSRDVTEP